MLIKSKSLTKSAVIQKTEKERLSAAERRFVMYYLPFPSETAYDKCAAGLPVTAEMSVGSLPEFRVVPRSCLLRPAYLLRGIFCFLRGTS